MRVEELTVEVRNESLQRVGQILPADLVGFKAVLRFNNVGTWEIELPVGHPVGEMLRLPGYGIVVTGPTGVLLSGPTTSAENTKERGNPDGTWVINGSDDSIILGERLAYPTPTTSDVTLQTNAYDTVTNTKASTAMYGYVKRNLESGTAPSDRVVPYLTCAPDTAFGTNVTKSARFNVLGELLSELAVVDGLGFDIKQQGNQLLFSVYQPVDRSKEIRMDIANNTLSKTSYGYAVPGVTKAIVAGQGQAEDRIFVEVTTTEATSAQALWGRRIENFIDQRNTSDSTELNRAGLERLAEAGNTITSVDVVPNSDTTMVPFVDWDLGDKVGVVIGGQEVAAIVTQIALSIESDGVRIGATVGEPSGVDYEALIAKRQQETSKSINALERKEGGGGATGGASIVVSDTPPAGVGANTLWLDSDDGALLVRYQDADTTQWIQVNNGTVADQQLTNRVTSLEGIRDVSIGGTGASTLASGGYLKGNGTGAITSQVGIPASDITSGSLAIARGGTGSTTGAGLVPVVPSSISVGSGSATVSATGLVTFTAVSSVSLNSVFSSAYRNYRMVLDVPTSTGGVNTVMGLRYRTGTTDNSSNLYFQYQAINRLNGALNTNSGGPNTFYSLGTISTQTNSFTSWSGDILMPFISTGQTSANGLGMGSDATNSFQVISSVLFNAATSFDGITILTNSGTTLTGTVKIYGYN